MKLCADFARLGVRYVSLFTRLTTAKLIMNLTHLQYIYADLQYATQKPLLIMDSIKSSLLIVGLLLSHGITMSSGLSTISRRRYLQWQTGGCIATTALANPSVAQAANLKSRTEGYAVQHTEREWAVSRFHMQYT